MENAFVHLTRVPDATDRCLTGKEKVNPSSFFLPFGMSVPSSSATNLPNSPAMKPNNSCRHIVKQRISSNKKMHNSGTTSKWSKTRSNDDDSAYKNPPRRSLTSGVVGCWLPWIQSWRHASCCHQDAPWAPGSLFLLGPIHRTILPLSWIRGTKLISVNPSFSEMYLLSLLFLTLWTQIRNSGFRGGDAFAGILTDPVGSLSMQRAAATSALRTSPAAPPPPSPPPPPPPWSRSPTRIWCPSAGWVASGGGAAALTGGA